MSVQESETDSHTDPRATFLATHPEIARVEAQFSGCCDDGQIETCTCFTEAGAEVVLTLQTDRSLDNLLYSLLETAFPGWEIDAGSSGTIHWDCRTNKASIDIEQYYTASTSDKWEEEA